MGSFALVYRAGLPCHMDAFNMAVLGGTNGKNGTSFRLLTILNFVGAKNKSQPHE
jgi:hypothetical protein